MRQFASVVVLLCLLAISDSVNILGVFPLKLKSHIIIYDSLLRQLAIRGHNVTMISPIGPAKPAVPNYRHVDVDSCDRMTTDFFGLDEAYKEHDPLRGINIMFSMASSDETVLHCPPVQQLLASNDSYDLVISELFITDTMLAFSQRFQSRLISICPSLLLPWAADRFGNPFNPAYVTYPYSSQVVDSGGSTFYERLYNTLVYLHSQSTFYSQDGKQELLKQKYFKFERPSLAEMASNSDLILTFSHFSISPAIPLVPNVVEVAGLQIKAASALPKDIEKFINESEHGVVYFCLGSLLMTETMPQDKLNAFLHAFSKIPQRILWKWGDDEMPGKTDQIFIAKWMPQRDILAHPNVKLFIAHGGSLGMNEAVYEGVPVLGIPMFADQTLNIKTLQSHGAAEILEYLDINNDTVLSKLQLMLNDQKYSENMKRVSAIFRDRPMSPMDTAIYWIEYVIRHKGARHLRSAAADLPLYQYLLLDVVAFVLFILFTALFLFHRVVKMLTGLICGSKSKLDPASEKILSKKKKK